MAAVSVISRIMALASRPWRRTASVFRSASVASDSEVRERFTETDAARPCSSQALAAGHLPLGLEEGLELPSTEPGDHLRGRDRGGRSALAAGGRDAVARDEVA